MTHPPYTPALRLDSFEALEPLERGRVLRLLVEALAEADRLYLARVRTPLLYQTSVRYADSNDEWRDVPAVLRAHGGDCKDLVAWRVAELRNAGRRVWPRIIMVTDDRRPGEFLYHVVAQHEGGAWEDPSKRLGM